MKNLCLCLVAAFFMAAPSTVEAQRISYGAEGRINRSSQMVYISGGTTQLNPISGLYAGAYVNASELFHNKVLNFFMYKARLAYARRGSTVPTQIFIPPYQPGSPDTSTIVIGARNVLNYVCLDLILQKEIFHLSKQLSFALEGGIGHDVLISGAVKTRAINGPPYPYDRYNARNLNRYTISWIAGVGINLEDKFSLFIESDKAFTPVYRSAELRVKGWSWSLGAAVKLGNFKLHQGQTTLLQ